MILEQKWNFLFLGLLVVGAVVVSMVYKSHNPICPDDFKDSEKEIASFSKWTDEFYQNNPNATIKEMSQARVAFWRENNCKEALKRYDDYMAGNADEETKQLIETATKETMIKNQVTPICPDDFEDISEEFLTFYDWWKNFIANNPNASMLEMLRERRNFYVKNNCIEAIKKHDEFLAGKTDKEAEQLIMNTLGVKIYNQKAYEFIENKKYKEAISTANEYLKKNPRSIDMWIHKSMAYYLLKDCKNASISIKKANEMILKDPAFENKDVARRLLPFILNSDICAKSSQ